MLVPADDLCYFLTCRLPELPREKASRDSSLRTSTTSYWSKCCQQRGVGKESIRQSIFGKFRSRFSRNCGVVLVQVFQARIT